METEHEYFRIRGNGLISCLRRLFYFILSVLQSELSTTEFKLTYKRLMVIAVVSVVFPSLMIWNHIGFWLDDVFFVDWMNQAIVAPLFIVGNARSGTTWVHRLITHDESTFTTFKTWEIMFAVSITWRWLFHTLYTLDQRYFHGLIYTIIYCVEDTLFSHVKVHPIGLNEAEEDDWVLIHIGMSQLIQFFFPLGGVVLGDLVMFDYTVEEVKPEVKSFDSVSSVETNTPKSSGIINDINRINNPPPTPQPALSQAVRMEIFQYYKECVQRHLYYHSHFNQVHSVTMQRQNTSPTILNQNSSDFPDVSTSNNAPKTPTNTPTTNTTNNHIKTRPIIFVSKNPAFTLRLSTLYMTFPDCRVLCMLRDPVQSVPSMVSYISKIWHVFASPVSRYPRVADLLGFCETHYLYPLRILRSSHLNDKQWSFLSYHHMLCDLEHSLLEVLDRLYPPYGYDDKCYSHNSAIHCTQNYGSCDSLLNSSGSGGLPLNSRTIEHHGSGGDSHWQNNNTANNCSNTTNIQNNTHQNNQQITTNGETRADNETNTQREVRVSEFRANEKLLAFLREEQIRANSYRGTHLHSVDMCCGGMTEGQLRDSLKTVYQAHQWAFGPLVQI